MRYRSLLSYLQTAESCLHGGKSDRVTEFFDRSSPACHVQSHVPCSIVGVRSAPTFSSALTGIYFIYRGLRYRPCAISCFKASAWSGSGARLLIPEPLPAPPLAFGGEPDGAGMPGKPFAGGGKPGGIPGIPGGGAKPGGICPLGGSGGNPGGICP